MTGRHSRPTRLALAFSTALALLMGCQVATRDKKVGAGVAAGTGLAGAAVYRAATGGCWAQCTHGTVCDRKTGTCVEMASAGPHARTAPSLPGADAEARWWESDPACPSGDKLDRSSYDEDKRVILCAGEDGVADGPVTFFHTNGKKQMQGEHCRGKPCRVWTYWDEDGKRTKVEDLGEPGALSGP